MKIQAGRKGAIVIEGHVQGLANTRALGEAGIPVIVLSEHNCLARYSRYCKKFFHCPPYISDNFISFLLDLAAKEDLKGWILLPSNDHAVFNISSNIDILQKYYRIISPGPEIIKYIYDKENLIHLCQGLEIPVPLSWFPGGLDTIPFSGLVYPVLVKGIRGLSFYKGTGRKAFAASGQKELKEILKNPGLEGESHNFYIQYQLPLEKNKAVSFTAFSINGEIKASWTGIKIREHPVRFGTSTYSKAIDVPELYPYAEKLLRTLCFTGVCEIEFLFDPGDGRYKLIEVNARTWLWVDMAIQSGVNYPLMIYNYLNSIEMNYPDKGYTECEWMHYITDIPFSLTGIASLHYNPIEILKSYLRAPRPAVFKLSDPLPSVAEVLLLPFLILKR